MKKIYTLVGLALISGALIAQAPYQYATHYFNTTEKYTPGAISVIPMHDHVGSQDRVVYYSEDFDGGYNGWDNDIITGPGIFQGFELTNVGHVNSLTNTFTIPDLATSTPTQWVMVDSDGGNTSYSNAEEAIMTSQRIDISASAGNYVALNFDQFFAEWDINTYTNAGSEDHCYISVSTDSAIWTTIEINEGIGRSGRPNPEWVSWDITDAVSSNLDSVWVRFTWEGAWNYGWQIDNIEIADNEQNDLAIVDAYRTYDLNGLVYSMSPVDHAQEFTIGCIIRNNGYATQTNIGFDFEIKDPSNAVVASGNVPSTISLDNREEDTLLVNTGFTPSDLGTYTITWTAVSDQAEDAPADNEFVDDHFELTEYTYAMDYNEGPAEGITEWKTFPGIAEFGTLFTVVVNDVVSGIDVKIANNASNIGTPIYAKIWYNNGTDGWLLYEETPTDYEIKASDIGQIITIPFDANGVDVDPDNLYMATVVQYDTPVDPIFERQGNIGFDYIQGVNVNEDIMAFFDRLAPIVRVRIGADELAVEETTVNEIFFVYPNPANDLVNIKLNMVESDNTVINVLDITGKVIKTIHVGQVNGDKNLSISLDEMTTGIYFVELVNADGKQVKKFVKK